MLVTRECNGFDKPCSTLEWILKTSFCVPTKKVNKSLWRSLVLVSKTVLFTGIYQYAHSAKLAMVSKMHDLHVVRPLAYKVPCSKVEPWGFVAGSAKSRLGLTAARSGHQDPLELPILQPRRHSCKSLHPYDQVMRCQRGMY